jgi:hypothetical protein
MAEAAGTPVDAGAPLTKEQKETCENYLENAFTGIWNV